MVEWHQGCQVCQGSGAARVARFVRTARAVRAARAAKDCEGWGSDARVARVGGGTTEGRDDSGGAAS